MKKLYVSAHRSPGGNETTDRIAALFDRVRAIRPSVRFCPQKDPFPGDDRIKALRFSGLSYGGHENNVFAYIGFPANASPVSPVPGMVLVHGGGGHAYAEWVQYWVDNGFAAISFDGFAQMYTGADHTYEADLSFWKHDPAQHYPQDAFASVGRPLLEQGFTYFAADVLLANSVLRADARVNKGQIGLTGISWGGIAASVAVCYDSRFAFAAPVYGCAFIDVTQTAWGAPFRSTDIAYVWDAGRLLGTVSFPVRFFNSDRDPFFDAAAATASAAAAPQGSLTLLPAFTHGQIEGSSIPELLRFAEEQVGRGDRNIKIEALTAAADGAELVFSCPSDVKTAEVGVYYKTEDIVYEEKYLQEPWLHAAGEVSGSRARVRIPANARLFYFCVQGQTVGDGPGQTLHATTGVYTRETWRDAEF